MIAGCPRIPHQKELVPKNKLFFYLAENIGDGYGFNGTRFGARKCCTG
jgi:hypothetical protein